MEGTSDVHASSVPSTAKEQIAGARDQGQETRVEDEMRRVREGEEPLPWLLTPSST